MECYGMVKADGATRHGRRVFGPGFALWYLNPRPRFLLILLREIARIDYRPAMGSRYEAHGARFDRHVAQRYSGRKNTVGTLKVALPVVEILVNADVAFGGTAGRLEEKLGVPDLDSFGSTEKRRSPSADRRVRNESQQGGVD